MARYPGLMLRILAEGHPAIGPGKAQLVALIDSTGSISAAAREMGMSYRRAWQLVEELNASFIEPVVVTAVGGKRGGGAVVTEFGHDLVKRFRAMEDRASQSIAADIERLQRQMRKPPRLQRRK